MHYFMLVESFPTIGCFPSDVSYTNRFPDTLKWSEVFQRYSLGEKAMLCLWSFD